MNSRGLAGAGAAHDTTENLPLALATVTAVGSFAVKVAASPCPVTSMTAHRSDLGFPSSSSTTWANR